MLYSVGQVQHLDTHFHLFLGWKRVVLLVHSQDFVKTVLCYAMVLDWSSRHNM